MNKDWVSVVTAAADLAIKVLPLIVSADGTERPQSDPYTVGPTTWYYLPEGRRARIKVVNTSEENVAINFSEFLSGGPFAITYVLEPEAELDLDREFADFPQGELCISSVTEDIHAETGEIRKSIAFAIKALSLGLACTLIGGLRIAVGANSGERYIHLINSGPKIASGTVEIEVSDGKRSVRLKGDLKMNPPPPHDTGPSEEQEWTFPIIGSELLDPAALDIYATLELPVPTFDELARDHVVRAKAAT